MSKAADPVAEMRERAKLSFRNQFAESEVVYANGTLDYERVTEAMVVFATDELLRRLGASGVDVDWLPEYVWNVRVGKIKLSAFKDDFVEAVAAEIRKHIAQPAALQWVKASERLPEDDSDVFAAVWWINKDNPTYSRYAIHDCAYYEGGPGSRQKIFSDCEGDEFEAADVAYWIYKKDLAASFPAPPEAEQEESK